ncbi:MAG: mucoidy inhibitor MuiA family protein [Gemmataceae bacterium]
MKRHLAILVGSLTLSLACLAVVFARQGAPAAAAPGGAGGKEGDAPRIAASRITHVTIYPDSALVTREVDVPAGNGLLELIINPLPEATMPSSLYTESGDGIRVLTTRFRTRPVKEDTREEVRKLEEEIKRLQQETRRLQAETQAIAGNTQMLTKLEGFATASTVHATEKGKLDSEATIALAKYLMDGRTEKSKQQVAVQEQMEKNTEALTFAQRQLAQLTTGTSKVERDAVIVVDKGQNGGGKVRLNYLVASAAWRPQYKLRAGKTTKDPVTLEYLAAVVQQTGEDWERVNVTLSTAQPMLNAAPPTLHALGRRRRSAARRRRGCR